MLSRDIYVLTAHYSGHYHSQDNYVLYPGPPLILTVLAVPMLGHLLRLKNSVGVVKQAFMQIMVIFSK